MGHSVYLSFLPDPTTFEGAFLVAVLAPRIVVVILASIKILTGRRDRKVVAEPELSPEPFGPRPDLRILSEIQPHGGGGGYLDFSFDIANYGDQHCRCELTAHVGNDAVECRPPWLDLIPNADPKRVSVIVPRPQLGELVPQFNHETTLYGKTLRVEATADEQRASNEWREKIYTPEENRQRHRIQQRVWRASRGEETIQDVREEHFDEVMRRRAEHYGRGRDFES